MTGSTALLARTATLVIVGAADRLEEAAAAIRSGPEEAALRVVLVSTSAELPAGADSHPDVVGIASLRPEFVDNAIAGVRLSSLPTVVWWRGGSPEAVDDVASLADRLILDVEDPWPVWRRVGPLVERTGFTDMRWARLTRWRAAMAHFFDLPEVRKAAATFSRVRIVAADGPRAALFAGWIDASLGWNGRVVPEMVPGGTSPLESVTLGGGDGELALRLHGNQTCLDAEARVGSRVLASRVVSAGDQQLSTLLSEELRVRSRDLAFERALQAALRQAT